MSANSVRDKHRAGFQKLSAQWDKLEALEAALVEVEETALEFLQDPIERSLDKLRAFEPSVSVIGQVKAGKSTLLNAMIGQTDLLPSDVNPWTSVITGIHLNARRRPMNTKALFRFFDANEWDRLVSTGGRLGEMADRAGFEAEADEVKAQVIEMRQTTEERLGDEFQTLLGSSHSFEELDQETINRYICYGDPEDLADGEVEGVYADLTKTADLYVDVEGFPQNLCLRDTPGVNDTFMMREQITLNAISESRVCIVVLSAMQALSTMDMALLRIICAVQAREVIIFVNRIDELVEPETECPKIEASIFKTLERMGLSTDIEVLFGSGYWANCALSGNLDKMLPASRASLESWAAAKNVPMGNDGEILDAALVASGVLDLHEATALRIIEGPAQWMIDDIETDIDNIISMSEMVTNIADRSALYSSDTVEIADIRAQVKKAGDQMMEEFDALTGKVRTALDGRLRAAQTSFIGTALATLESHIATHGEKNSWNHEPTTLRMMLSSSYLTASTKFRRAVGTLLERFSDAIHEIAAAELGILDNERLPECPAIPDPRVPTVLAKTLSLDLSGNWWEKFWNFGAKKRLRTRYSALILEETNDLLGELMDNSFEQQVEGLRAFLSDFAYDHDCFFDAIFECIEKQSDEAAETEPEVKQKKQRVA